MSFILYMYTALSFKNAVQLVWASKV